ncbi:unnamed protein product [Rotaria magnacalcarata]|uniref:Uncharacterized protein n=1 Tax=Rotaria magnacalcarata TaxID=392030 RepID=A0A814TSW2_9BILA|nr:unnamed protein product [Rotaria magnacalcarata]CAF1919772.1 unnamed protein product [Rotaria magnacalcarata]
METSELDLSRIHGFTSWINMRLMPFEQGLNHILTDLMKGTNMKMLLQSVTGTTTEKIQSFEKLSPEQIRTRCEWAVKHLKEHQVIPEDVQVDARLFAVRSAKHVFDLLWRLVEHDIWFLWERIDFLLQDDAVALLSVPLKWIPTDTSSKTDKLHVDVSLLAGFGTKDVVDDVMTQAGQPGKKPGKFSETEQMLAFSKRNLTKKYPKPSACIIEMIQIVLQKLPEGRRINFTKLNELSDLRVLCSLVNYFVPNLIPTEILLNDRWSLNLTLAIIDDVLCCKSNLASEDLVLGDEMSICAFMCYFFLVFLKYRQNEIAIRRTEEIRRRHYNAVQKLRATNQSDQVEDRPRVEQEVFQCSAGKKKYDLQSALQWNEHVEQTRLKVITIIGNKLKVRFDWFDIPEEITIAEVCRQKAVNLVLTEGSAFYRILDRKQEIVTAERSFILIHKQSRQIIVDKSLCKRDDDSLNPIIRKANVRSILGIANANDHTEVKADRYPQYEVYINAPSQNKVLPDKTTFLYQVFPDSLKFYHNFLLKACGEGHFDSVFHLVQFLQKLYPDFINMHEAHTLNTALHVACRHNNMNIARYCLDNGAHVDSLNKDENTPLFCAAERFSSSCAKLLLEYGADITIKNSRKRTVTESCVSDEFQQTLIDVSTFIGSVVPALTSGDREILDRVISDHVEDRYTLSSLNSRFINGSTLLHTACYFNNISAVKRLLKLGVNPDVRDYQGKTALHRTRDLQIIKFLIESNADVNATDHDGNTPLHTKCAGEYNKPVELHAIQVLHEYGASLEKCNSNDETCFHIAARNGHTEILRLLFELGEETVRASVRTVEQKLTPQNFSTLALAIHNDHLDAAKWLAEHEFTFKQNEAKDLINEILTEKISSTEPERLLQFLCKEGNATLSTIYQEGNTALHLAASMASVEPLKLLLTLGFDPNTVNQTKETPLFVAARTNNLDAACVLIDNGVDYRIKNIEGYTAFDYILDIDEWLSSEKFDEETKACFRAYKYKDIRTLIYTVSSKLDQFDARITANHNIHLQKAYQKFSYEINKTEQQVLQSPRLRKR